MKKNKETYIRISDEARLAAKSTCKKMGLEFAPAVSRAIIKIAKEKPDFFMPEKLINATN